MSRPAPPSGPPLEVPCDDPRSLVERFSSSVATLADFHTVLDKFFVDAAFSEAFVENRGLQALSGYLRKRTVLEVMGTTALAIMAQKASVISDECMVGVCWPLRRDGTSVEQQQLALEILLGVCQHGRERALTWLRHLQRLCRDPALLGRLAELLSVEDVGIALAASQILVAWSQTGDRQQQAATQREMLLLRMADTCRKKQRDEALSQSFRALLKVLRANARPESFSVSLGDETLPVKNSDTAGVLEKKLHSSLLFAGCVPQSGVFLPASRILSSMGVPLRCERWPLPWTIRIEGPLGPETGCRIDSRLTGERALAYVAAAHVQDQEQARDFRLKVKGGRWLDPTIRLDAQCDEGCVLFLRVPPPSVELEVAGEPKARQLALMLHHSVADVVEQLRKPECGIWMRVRGESSKKRRWLELDQTLAECGVDAEHVLRCEPRPLRVEISYKKQLFTVETMEQDTVDGVLLHRARKAAGLSSSTSNVKLFGTTRQHQLFGWASLTKQGVRERLVLKTPDPPAIYEASLQSPSILDDPRLSKDLFWEEKDPSQLECASLNAIVALITGSKSSVNLIHMVLVTYHSFTESAELLKLLMQRSRTPSLDVPIRVLGVLKQWLDVEFNLPSEILDNINVFLERDIAPQDKLKAPLHALRNALLRWSRGDVRKYKILEPPPRPMLPQKAARRFRDIPPIELARQVTLHTFSAYSSIEAHELFGNKWSKEKTQHLCPNVMHMIASYNDLAQRMASAIVLSDTVRRRVKMIVHVLEMAQELRTLQNYHSLSALVSALGNASVIRLKHTWEALPKRWQRVNDELKSLCDMGSSFKNLRDVVLRGDPPKIPYVGVYLSDLTFIEDGNPDTVERDGREYIYLSKRVLFHKILSTIKTWQVTPYNLTPLKLVDTILGDMKVLQDKELYAESLLREPRE